MNIDEIFKNVSDSAKPKLDTVTGKSSKAEANIAGITPAVFILKEDEMTRHRTFCYQLVFSDNLLIFFS